MVALPLRGTVTGGMSLPASGRGVGWAIVAGVALMAGTVTTGLRFLRYRAWRTALVGSALGRNAVMLLSVIVAPLFPEVVEAGRAELAVADGVLNIAVPEIRLER